MIYQTIEAQKDFSAIYHINQNIHSLGKLGDDKGTYFGYAREIFIEHLYLQLSKIYSKDKSSINLSKIINKAKLLFTKQDFNELPHQNDITYESVKTYLNDLSDKYERLNGLKSIKAIRDKTLAHFDKENTSINNLQDFTDNNSLRLEGIRNLIEFAIKSLLIINKYLFNNNTSIFRDYFSDEIKKIASLIEKY